MVAQLTYLLHSVPCFGCLVSSRASGQCHVAAVRRNTVSKYRKPHCDVKAPVVETCDLHRSFIKLSSLISLEAVTLSTSSYLTMINTTKEVPFARWLSGRQASLGQTMKTTTGRCDRSRRYVRQLLLRIIINHSQLFANAGHSTMSSTSHRAIVGRWSSASASSDRVQQARLTTTSPDSDELFQGRQFAWQLRGD